jgi:hypothetical protein
MDDDGSALRVGAKYKSFTDLECVLKKFEQDNYVQLFKRSSRKLGTGSKYKNMEVAESAAGLLIYKELDYSCIHGGNILVPFPTVNAQTQGKTQGKITYNIP